MKQQQRHVNMLLQSQFLRDILSFESTKVEEFSYLCIELHRNGTHWTLSSECSPPNVEKAEIKNVDGKNMPEEYLLAERSDLACLPTPPGVVDLPIRTHKQTDAYMRLLDLVRIQTLVHACIDGRDRMVWCTYIQIRARARAPAHHKIDLTPFFTQPGFVHTQARLSVPRHLEE